MKNGNLQRFPAQRSLYVCLVVDSGIITRTPMDKTYNPGRKALLTMLGLILISFLVWFKRIDSATFGMCFVGSLGAYIVGNVYQAKQELHGKN